MKLQWMMLRTMQQSFGHVISLDAIKKMATATLSSRPPAKQLIEHQNVTFHCQH